MANTQHKAKQIIFVIVQGGVAEVDLGTVPEGVEVEVIDLDDLKADRSSVRKLSRAARAYARQEGYL